MTPVLSSTEPRNVFRFFEELCQLPHGTGNTKAATDWAVNFAKERNLEYRQEPCGNVIIRKPASPGYEDHPVVMLQGHLDMVCVKDDGVEHDFFKDPLDLQIDGDWIYAKGTSLGGDDGIAIAMAMAVLDDDTLPHPALEAVFTIDEEVGMPGVIALDGSDLKSRYILNIDSEIEGVLTVGCSGGSCDTLTKAMPAEKAEGVLCTMLLQNLSGGHSGTAIHEGHANPNKLMGEALAFLGYPRLVSLFGGLQDNAIPTSSKAVILVDPSEVADLKAKAQAWADKTKAACPVDPNFTYTWSEEVGTANALSREDSRTAAEFINALPNGVQAMNPNLAGQVQTSLNMGVLRLEDGRLRFTFLSRSSCYADLRSLVKTLQDIAAKFGAEFVEESCYSPWEYNPSSKLQEIAVQVFKEQYGKDPKVETVHAGLECGILIEKAPGAEALSIGPDILNIHSTRERLGISSVQRTWEFVKAVLAAL